MLVIGAGRAGLRAAIEASTGGVSVGLVCKSLLGKAHTVMAEGGIAAAMANVDDRDNWKVHFSDTMRGGQYVNNWRMAELHAKEAPDRVRELEAWGAMFDRTKEGKILQRNFGGHRYPRLAHVGDRTGLEMIRTLQDHGIHQGIDVHMECTIVTLLKDGDRVVGAFGYERERGRFKLFRAKAVLLATGWGRSRVQDHQQQLGVHGRRAHARLRRRRRSDGHGVRAVPSDGHGVATQLRGLLVTEAVRGEGGVLKNSEGRRFMFDDIPANYRAQTADNEEEGWRYTQGDKGARRHAGAVDRDRMRPAASCARSKRAAFTPAAVLDIAWIKARLPHAAEHIKKKLPSMYHQFKQLADLDITREPMEIGPTTHYIMGGVRVDADTQMSSVPGLFAAGECAAGINGANRLGGNSLSDILVFGKRAGEFAARYSRTQKGAATVDARQVDEAARRALEPFERGTTGEGPYQVQYALQDLMQDLVGIVDEPEMRRTRGPRGLREQAAHVGAGRSTTPAGTPRWICTIC